MSIFISSYRFFTSPFEAYFSYLVFLMFFPIFFVKFGIPRSPVLLFIPILISGITYVAMGYNTSGQFFKIFIGFFTSVLFYHYVVELFQFNLKALYKYYMIAATIISVIGLMQLASFWVGFKPGYDLRWIGFNKWALVQGGLGIRVNSIFSEPAYFAASIGPAFFTAIYNWSSGKTIFIDRKWSAVIILAYVSTFSSVGIIGIFITITLLLLNFGFIKYAIVFIPLSIVFFNYSYESVPEFRERYDGTVEIFQTGEYRSYDIHGSSFVLYNNYHVALENFKRNPLFGTGLGSHPVAFDKYSLTNLEGAVDIEFNKQDANSMFLRLMSETGLYGLFIMLYLLIKCWVPKQRTSDNELWVMSNSVAIIIVLSLLRQGHYFINGFPFYLWLFYYIAKENWALRAVELEKEEQERHRNLIKVINSSSA
jgi:hypothetical protein